jgi:adenylate kinase family enzyme
MRRVLVIGCGGSGKSTLARRLGEVLELPVIHLDRHFWYPGWVETSREEFRERVRELVAREAWIMDGNYSSTLDLRLEAADTAVFLDYPRAICLRRILRRRVLSAFRPRPDMNPDCPERLNWEFVRYVWNYRKSRRPGILERLREYGGEVHVLRNDAEVDQFLGRVKGASGVR